MASGKRQRDGDAFNGFDEINEVCRYLIVEDVERRSQSCRLQLSDDCRDGLDLAGIFSVFHWFCKHVIGVIIVSAEGILVSLGGWYKKPTGGIRVHFSRCLLTGKLKVCGSLFDWRWAIALM